MAKAAFAAGCFWGVEAEFRQLKGITDAAVGYMGGSTPNPTYKDVCTGRTGHAEAVQVEFDPQQVSYEQLVRAFFGLHDPTTLDRQGPDWGSQYRSAIFFYEAQQEATARAVVAELDRTGVFRRKIVTQIVPAARFFRAEEYHQRYFEKQGINACRPH